MKPTWRDAFDRLITFVLQDAIDIGVDLPLPYDDLYARLQLRYPPLDEVTAPRFVHWDLWDGNVFIDPDRHQISGLIDFERALWADPLMEVNFGSLVMRPALLGAR